jgi:hypothetical protein
MRNMKKGGLKKNKERIAVLMNKMLLIKPLRERLEEFTISLEYIDERSLKQFRNLTSMYFRAYDAGDAESDSLRDKLAA